MYIYIYICSYTSVRKWIIFTMTRKPFQIKFLCLLDIDRFTPRVASRIRHRQMDSQRLIQRNKNLKATVATRNWVLGFTTFPKTMAESSPSVFLIVMGPQIWVNFGKSKACVFYRSSVTSPLHRFYHHFESSLTLCLTVALLCVRRISTRSNIWNSNGPKRQSVPSCPNQSTLSGC